MKMNILVTGSKGQLASEIRDLSGNFSDYNFFFTSREELDISKRESVEKFLEINNIDTIINCAAYTAVDNAESEQELADEINHLAVRDLAQIAEEKSVRLIHISTDYVFDGKGFRPYSTNQPTNPINTYGRTKLDGEIAIKKISPQNGVIIRTSWVYSSFGNNFVKTMLRLGEERKELNVINDQVGAPTYARDLANFILENIITRENEGLEIYHFSNEGVCSWYDFAKEIMESAELECKINPIPSSQYPTPAKRPYYSLMDKNQIIKDFGYNIPHWKDSLRECIKKLIA